MSRQLQRIGRTRVHPGLRFTGVVRGYDWFSSVAISQRKENRLLISIGFEEPTGLVESPAGCLFKIKQSGLNCSFFGIFVWYSVCFRGSVCFGARFFAFVFRNDCFPTCKNGVSHVAHD